MSFTGKYSSITSIVNADITSLNESIKKLFDAKTPLDLELLEFLLAPSKRLRPVLGFLFLKGLFSEINQQQKDVLLAVELIHNASLIHDDVIDNSEKRRAVKTLNAKFDNNLAVIAGDFLLSLAFEIIISVNNPCVTKLFALALKKTCEGEISQYFSKFKIPAIDEYIEKSKNKTALLFEIGILSGIHLESSINDDEKKFLLEKAMSFSENFGVAFQIRDDLLNISKVNSDDLSAGIYTAPVIFASAENDKLLSAENLQSAVSKTRAIEKTRCLIDNYFTKAEAELNVLKEENYKKAIIELINLLKRDF